jgi:hypothetical protein
MVKGILFYIALFFLLISPEIFGEEINTGNILTNSTFGTGTTYSSDGWNVSSGTSGHNYMSIAGGNAPGGTVASTGNTNINQTVTLSEDTNMTTPEIQNGWSSTMSTDIWYWHQYSNTTTLRQTITGSDGSTSTQQRVIQDTGCGYSNCGSYTNYTDTYIQGSNTQTDFDIRVDIDNLNNRGGHSGPDIDDVQLNVSYTYIPPIDNTTQTIIDDIDTDIVTIIDDIPEDFDWDNDELVFEEEYTWGEEEYTWEDEYIVEDNFYFEEELDFEVTEFDSPPMFEDFEEFDVQEMPTMEEVFFETEFMEEPPMMTEELFTEEFEEDFTSFIEETGLEEEFEQFLEEEGITAEEFFEEITEEEFSDELTDESFEEFEEPMEEIASNEESVPEVIEEKEETVEEPSADSEPIDGEKEVANNATEESTEEEEPSSESTEESEVQPEDSEEQDTVQSEGRDEVDSDDRVATDVAKIETKLKQNLKRVAKQIAQATKESTQNLTKEDIFFKNNTLNAYTKTKFYKSKDIYTDTNLDFFNQIDLGVYDKEIYIGITLNSYTVNDVVEVYNRKIQQISIKKRQILAELEALKQ